MKLTTNYIAPITFALLSATAFAQATVHRVYPGSVL